MNTPALEEIVQRSLQPGRKSWTTNDELIQHLTLSLEGAAAEVLKRF